MNNLTAIAIAYVEATHPRESAAVKAMLAKAYVDGALNGAMTLVEDALGGDAPTARTDS